MRVTLTMILIPTTTLLTTPEFVDDIFRRHLLTTFFDDIY